MAIRQPKEPALHFIGNGKMGAYLDRGNIAQLFGPPYSSGSVFTVRAEGEFPYPSFRRPGTGIWESRLFDAKGEAAVIVDLAGGTLSCYARRIKAQRPVRLVLEKAAAVPQDFSTVCDWSSEFPGAVFLGCWQLDEGVPLYNQIPFPEKQYYMFLVTGAATVECWEGKLIVTADPGISDLFFAGGTTLQQADEAIKAAAESGFSQLEREETARWQTFFSAHPPKAVIPPNSPRYEELCAAIESIMVAICSQQSKEGGILAGHPYHLAYVRDQYGGARGLLRMGCVAEARRILEHYRHIFSHNGRICNAQAMGVEGIVHFHENDNVEITGYLVRAAFDLFEKEKDEAFLCSLLPMLLWAVKAQIGELKDGMLPFNGDETYVAGGILPRKVLNDGSSEATMLFIDGTERFLDFFGTRLEPVCAKEIRSALEDTKAKFSSRFLPNGQLITNNPQRKQGLVFPPYRHGVCHGWGIGSHCQMFGWGKHVGNGVYLCPQCIADGVQPQWEDEIFSIKSVSFSARYLGSKLVPKEFVEKEILDAARRFLETGLLPSRPEGGRTVGYDYGFLLYNLVGIDQQLALEVYHRTLDLLDETGAYTEYYEDGVPSGSRYRPWESSINAEALLHFVQTYY